MPFHDANPAGFSHLAPCKLIHANYSLQSCNGDGGSRPPYSGYAFRNRSAIVANLRSSQCADVGHFGLERVYRCVSRLLLGHSFGAFPAPGGTRSSASHFAPLRGHGSSQSKFEIHGKERRQTFFGSLPESRSSALGSRAHSLSSAQCDPSNNGRIQQMETLPCTRTK
jgi:hypothetical protein